LLGAEEKIGLAIGPTYHGYSQENRQAMYRWFNHVTKISDAQAEPALTIEKDETLWCTPRGQVAESKPRTLFSFTRERSEALKQRRGAVASDALPGLVRDTLRLPERSGVPDYRILRPSSKRAYPKKFAATYAVETELGILALVYRLDDAELTSRPPRGAKRAILYVAHSLDASTRRTAPRWNSSRRSRIPRSSRCDVEDRAFRPARRA